MHLWSAGGKTPNVLLGCNLDRLSLGFSIVKEQLEILNLFQLPLSLYFSFDKATFDSRFLFNLFFFFLEQELCSNVKFLNRSSNHVLIVSLEVVPLKIMWHGHDPYCKIAVLVGMKLILWDVYFRDVFLLNRACYLHLGTKNPMLSLMFTISVIRSELVFLYLLAFQGISSAESLTTHLQQLTNSLKEEKILCWPLMPKMFWVLFVLSSKNYVDPERTQPPSFYRWGIWNSAFPKMILSMTDTELRF